MEELWQTNKHKCIKIKTKIDSIDDANLFGVTHGYRNTFHKEKNTKTLNAVSVNSEKPGA